MGASIQRNEQFDYIKAISVVMVVLHHCIDNYVSITSDSFILIRMIIVLLHTCHVPIFLIVAGYFCHEQPIVTFYKKKVLKILVPFISFSLLKLLYSIHVSNEFAHGGETILSQVKYSFLIGRQYWFIYTILGIYLIAPLFWTKKDGSKSNGLIGLIISYIAVCVIALFGITLPELFQLDHIINYLPFFVFGCVLKQRQEHIVEVVTKIDKKISLPAAGLLVLAFLTIYIYHPGIRNYPVRFWVALLVFFQVYELTKMFKNGIHIFEILSKYSLQVMFFDGIFRILTFAILIKLNIVNIAMVLIVTIFVIFLSVIACRMIEKIPIVNKLVGL